MPEFNVKHLLTSNHYRFVNVCKLIELFIAATSEIPLNLIEELISEQLKDNIYYIYHPTLHYRHPEINLTQKISIRRDPFTLKDKAEASSRYNKDEFLFPAKSHSKVTGKDLTPAAVKLEREKRKLLQTTLIDVNFFGKTNYVRKESALCEAQLYWSICFKITFYNKNLSCTIATPSLSNQLRIRTNVNKTKENCLLQFRIHYCPIKKENMAKQI